MNKKLEKMISGKKIVGLGARRVVYDLENGFVFKLAIWC